MTKTERIRSLTKKVNQTLADNRQLTERLSKVMDVARIQHQAIQKHRRPERLVVA